MANYFTLGYESAASSPGSVELNGGFPTSDGLTVQVSLYAGSGFTPTHYKMWGVELVDGEGVVTISGAQWISHTPNRTVGLAYHNNPQYAYVKFKNAGETETETFQSNSVTFSFVEPIIHASTAWKTSFEESNFDSTTSNKLANIDSSIEIEINKNKLDQFSFSGADLSGLRCSSDTIYVDPSSDFYKFIGLNEQNHIAISKTFSSSAVPLIMVDSGSGFTTLTAYDGAVKSTVSGLDATRVSGTLWDANTNNLTFDVYRFSTYGFCTIQKVQFTGDSQTGVYVGNVNTFRVYVQDTNGEAVESAPVTISGISGNIGTIQESMPVNTDALGIAEFNLNVTSVGTAVFRATVDSVYTSEQDLVVNGVEFPDAQRSLLTQYEQIRRSGAYSDTVSGVNTSVVAEPTTPTVSGLSDSVIEHDLNVLRTLVKQIKGTSYWYDSVPSYFDPISTDAIDTETGTASFASIAGNTLDSKTIITAVSDNNSGNGFSITPGDAGFLFNVTLSYATPTNRIGMPIFNSATNSGTYYDEAGIDAVVGIDLINLNTGGEFKDSSGNIIFAKFHDGADFSGSGDGTDAYVKFYTSDGPYTFTSDDPTSIMVVYPVRRRMSDVAEYEWERTDFISSWEGDSVIINNVSDLWSYTGSLDNEKDPSWTVISGSPMVDTSDTSLKGAIDTINTEIGSGIFTENNYISSSQSITAALDALDTNLFDIFAVATTGIAEKYVQILANDVNAGVAHQLPVGLTYTPKSDSGQQGGNMDVFLDGQLLSASTGSAGINSDKDYSETDTTHITFHFKVHQYSNITYVIRN